MTLRKKTLAILLGSTALATSISFDVIARVEISPMESSLLDLRSSGYKVSPTKDIDNVFINDIVERFERERKLESVDTKGKKSEISSLSDSWIQVDTPLELVEKTALKPLVSIDEDGNKRVNPNFSYHRDTLLEMNALSYAIAKRQSASDNMNRWIAALNSNAMDHAEFLEELEDDFFGCMDMLDVFEEMDYQDRRHYINKEISKLEKYIQEQISAEQRLADVLYKGGWELKAFEGKSGYKRALGNPGDSWVDDDRGFVAFHRASNTIAVTYHGSRDGSDWEANFDGRQVKASTTGLTLPGDVKVHRGFANIVESCKDNVARLVKEFHDSIEESKKKKAQIFVTGHSLGAALATLSTAELVHNLGPQLFGEGFSNTESNNFKGFYVSAPKAFGQTGVEMVSDLVGHDNMMRQNVHGDPVPVAALKKVEAKLKSVLEWVQGDRKRGETGLARIPLVGKWLEDAMFKVLEKPQFKVFLEENLTDALEAVSGYHSVGHLALDDTGGALKRMLWPATKALVARTGANFVGMIKGYWGALVGNNVPNPGITGFIANTVYDVAATVVAPLHYGTTLVGEGGAFDKDLPSKKTDLLLKQGQDHLDAKEVAKETSSEPKKKSLWSRAKSKVGGWFGY